MGIFGWSYPPGAANDPYAPYNQDYDDETEEAINLTISQRDKIKRMRANIDKAKALPPEPIPTFSEVWRPVGEMLSNQGKSKYEEEEAGDWNTSFNGDTETWRKYAYTFTWDAQGEVMHGKKGAVIEVYSVDCDGSDFECATYDGDLDWEFFYRDYMSKDSYFKGWAEYHLWCAENGGIDPLEEFYDTPTVDKHIAAAQDMVKCLLKRRK